MEPRAYYYADGTDHVVYLTKAQADALIKCEILTHIEDPDTGKWWVQTNLTEDEMVDYNAGAAILNEYHAIHGAIDYVDTSKPIVRPVE